MSRGAELAGGHFLGLARLCSDGPLGAVCHSLVDVTQRLRVSVLYRFTPGLFHALERREGTGAFTPPARIVTSSPDQVPLVSGCGCVRWWSPGPPPRGRLPRRLLRVCSLGAAGTPSRRRPCRALCHLCSSPRCPPVSATHCCPIALFAQQCPGRGRSTAIQLDRGSFDGQF